LLLAAALALPVAALLLAGCGLENVPVLSQPGFLGYGTGEIFHFQNGPPGADAGFLGYDLYYKIYDISDTFDINISTIDELKQKFRRLTQYTTAVQPSPLVAIADPLLSFEVVVDFSGDFVASFNTLPQIYSIPPGPPDPPGYVNILAFRRGVTYSSSSETKLFKDFDQNDADIDATIWADLNNAGTKVAIALYVVSYGVDPSYGALYSIPLYLGDIQLNLPPYP
jgi:hypothetical protein